MELETNFSVNQLNQQIKVKNYYPQTQKNVSKKELNSQINRSMGRISRVMSDLIPKSRHSMNDVNLLQLTIEYLKQTADFQRGIVFCAEETKSFLKDRHLDSNKMNKLIKEINRRINSIPEPKHFQVIKTTPKVCRLNVTGKQATDSFLQDNWHINQSSLANGILLDLSMKQNRLRYDDTSDDSTTRFSEWCNNSKKREKKQEILNKIRNKILEKRRLSTQRTKIVEDEDLMWRPWRL